ncbi:hypothetical protein GQ43DRAFT_480895 [Delitschia confertaspora ATCC 74209]|uniref:BZIP domain-containing protein n=1 Tax=Delitschia confertaspora ATCC 74209 TaxID=1513339 RepID=A0A9P4MS85_9PLEO|nr:hypothetical protein GQ43DRAFT_480895 [Delitschia confertaspora ATCC 74209]
MASENQPPVKRGRTAASERGYLSPTEELSQVASLVERRRVQNRISQRNYRNKIRTRLEKLEALVESNKAQKEGRSTSSGTVTPPASTTHSRTPSEYSTAAPGSYSHSQTIPNDPTKSTQQQFDFCKCMLEPQSFFNINGTDFEPMCQCPHAKRIQQINQPSGQGHHGHLDTLTPVSTFLDTDGTEHLYGTFPSPEPLQCPSPSTMHVDIPNPEIPITTSMSNQTTLSPSTEPLSMLTIDPTSRPQFPSRLQYPYHLSMSTTMVPMGFVPIPTSDYTIQDSSTGRASPMQPYLIQDSRSQPSTPPAGPIQSFMWVPTPIMMVPVQHPMHPQQSGSAPGSEGGS